MSTFDPLRTLPLETDIHELTIEFEVAGKATKKVAKVRQSGGTNMSVIAALALMLAQTSPTHAVASTPKSKGLGSGPHTLLILNQRSGSSNKIEYRTGPACQKALDAIEEQSFPPTRAAPTNGVPQMPRMTSFEMFCVPR